MSAAARTGDSCVPHCSPFNISGGSGTVFVNNRGAARVGDSVSPHLMIIIPPKKPYCKPHAPSISSGSNSVYINGKKAARVGSSIKGCTKVSGGSGDVFIGG